MTEHTSLTESDEQAAPDTRARHLVLRFPGRKAPTTDAVLTTKQPGHFRHNKLRYRGLFKNTAQRHTVFALDNLAIVKKTLLAQSRPDYVRSLS